MHNDDSDCKGLTNRFHFAKCLAFELLLGCSMDVSWES